MAGSLALTQRQDAASTNSCSGLLLQKQTKKLHSYLLHLIYTSFKKKNPEIGSLPSLTKVYVHSWDSFHLP